MKIHSPYLVKPGQQVRLTHFPSDDHGGYKHDKETRGLLEEHCQRLDKLQETFYASQKHALLIVLQGMDAAGKDGAIRHIFSGVNPQGCQVASFKVPTALESRHDFLWRVHNAVPPRGIIGIFNRSHYEDVLSPRVHKVISEKVVKQRLHEINIFEKMLHDNGVLILKFFLHVSFKEQGDRLQSRLDDPEKHWKLEASDFHERRFWPAYQKAYEELLAQTSQKHAPWFIIPSDHKWYRNLAISTILIEAVNSLKLAYPKSSLDVSKLKT